MFLQATLALLLVVFLIIIVLFGLKIFFSNAKNLKDIKEIFKNRVGFNKTLRVEEVSLIDNKYKVVLIKHKNRKYILLIGGGKGTVIEKFHDSDE